MQLSNIGVLANVFWHEILNHAENVELGAFVVMPNHVHGIFILDDDCNIINGDKQKPDDDAMQTMPNIPVVQTTHALSPPEKPSPIGQFRFQNQGKNSLSSIIGSYKSTVSKHAHRLGYEFEWQSRFYDHIIRDDQSFKNISNYIFNNPAKWTDDKFK